MLSLISIPKAWCAKHISIKAIKHWQIDSKKIQHEMTRITCPAIVNKLDHATTNPPYLLIKDQWLPWTRSSAQTGQYSHQNKEFPSKSEVKWPIFSLTGSLFLLRFCYKLVTSYVTDRKEMQLQPWGNIKIWTCKFKVKAAGHWAYIYWLGNSRHETDISEAFGESPENSGCDKEMFSYRDVHGKQVIANFLAYI